jgi:hypothetical protein
MQATRKGKIEGAQRQNPPRSEQGDSGASSNLLHAALKAWWMVQWDGRLQLHAKTHGGPICRQQPLLECRPLICTLSFTPTPNGPGLLEPYPESATARVAAAPSGGEPAALPALPVVSGRDLPPPLIAPPEGGAVPPGGAGFGGFMADTLKVSGPPGPARAGGGSSGRHILDHLSGGVHG